MVTFIYLILALIFPPQIARNIQNISAPIVINTSNKHLDYNFRTFTLKDSSECPMFIIGYSETIEPTFSVENISITNLIINGNSKEQKFEIWNNQDNFIRNNGITIRKAKNVKISNCIIINCRSGGIVIEKNSENIIIENCVLSKNFYDGIACYDSTKCVIRNCLLMDNNAAGISFDLNFNNNLIENNIIIRNDIGIFVRHCSDNIFKKNFIKNAAYDLYFNKIDNDITTYPKNNKLENNITYKDMVQQDK